MYSFGATVLPVCPTCVAYGYQPASTTARVAATAPPSAEASSSTSAKLSGDPSPRPPATITSASSIDGPPSPSSLAASTSSASSECGSSSTATSRTAHVRSRDDAGGLAERAGLRQHAERRLRDGAFVMLEEDEKLHSTRFSARNSRIASAASFAEPSSTRRLSPRAGGGASARTTV